MATKFDASEEQKRKQNAKYDIDIPKAVKAYTPKRDGSTPKADSQGNAGDPFKYLDKEIGLAKGGRVTGYRGYGKSKQV